MSISGIGGISSSAMAFPVQPGFRSAMTRATSAVAPQLGMNVADLQVQLNSGKSLADLAAAKGVSATDLVARIKQSLSSTSFPATGHALDPLAHRIANHKL